MCLPVHQVHTLEVFQKELNESESQVFQAVVSLHRALQGDYRDVVNMKESSRLRLQALREAAIKVRRFPWRPCTPEMHADESWIGRLLELFYHLV